MVTTKGYRENSKMRKSISDPHPTTPGAKYTMGGKEERGEPNNITTALYPEHAEYVRNYISSKDR